MYVDPCRASQTAREGLHDGFTRLPNDVACDSLYGEKKSDFAVSEKC